LAKKTRGQKSRDTVPLDKNISNSGTLPFKIFDTERSVAKGPKFWPQNTKGAEKNSAGPVKSGAEFLQDLQKRGSKFLWGSKKSSRYTYQMVYCIFSHHVGPLITEKQ
jgi:hypothetical protein